MIPASHIARPPWVACLPPLKALLLAAALSIPGWMPVSANAGELWPLTKVRLTVVQWNPIKGLYERWDALTGEYMIGSDGSMLLPVVGALATSDRTNEQIAADIAGALRDRLGLVQVPEATVEIVSYPPIYVVGEVVAPGAFDYRPGMTVLQAFALSGGMQPEAVGVTAERVRLSSELRTLADNLLRGRARLARLEAENAGASSIDFPEEVTANPDAEAARTAMAEEASILEARLRELRRQADSLDGLVVLLNMEIDTLDSRIVDIERAIDTAENELAGVQTLVQKGLATASRQSDLERAVADLRFDGLTQKTAIIRAQQALNEASREAARLADTRQTQLALDIQEQRAALRQLLVQQATAQRLLFDLDVGQVSVAGATTQLTFTIVRQDPDGPFELSGDEVTTLVPGDVLKVAHEPHGASTTKTNTAEVQVQP